MRERGALNRGNREWREVHSVRVTRVMKLRAVHSVRVTRLRERGALSEGNKGEREECTREGNKSEGEGYNQWV